MNYMKKMLLLIILMFLIATPARAAVNGVQDLSNWNFEKDGIVKLDGEWEFYWEQLLSPADFAGKTNQKPVISGYIKVPGSWVKGTKDRKFPPRGAATYRLRVKLEDVKAVYGLKTTNLRMDSRIYVNGALLMENGGLVSNALNILPGNTPQVGYFAVNGNILEIIVQVTNYNHKRGGIIQNIYLGNQQDVENKKFLLTISDAGVISVILIIGLLHLLTYLISFFRKQKENLLLSFSLMCFVYAIAIACFDEKLLYQLLPFISYELLYKTSDFFLAMTFIFNAIFLIQLGEGVITSKFTKSAFVIGGIYILFVVFTPLSNYTLYQDYFSILQIIYLLCIPILLFSAYLKKNYGIVGKNGMLILSIAFVFPVIAGANQALYYGSYVNEYILTNWSLLLFTLMIVFVLANKFAEDFKEAKESEIAFLQAQVKPHFLYNTLNSIAALCRKQPQEAEKLTLEFASYLRSSFDFKNLETLTTSIPSGGTVKITIKKTDKGKLFSVSDNGKGMDKEKIQQFLNGAGNSGSIGLQNINNRLKSIYGVNLEIEAEEGKGTTVSFLLPKESL